MADFIYINASVDNMTTMKIYIDKHKTTADLYSAIRKRDEIKGIQLDTIILEGNPLLESDSSSLESSGIRNGCTVVLCIKVHGGGGNASTPEQEAPAFVLGSNASKPKEEAPVYNFFNIRVTVNNATTLNMVISKHKTTADLYSAIRKRDEMKEIQLDTIVLVLDGNPLLESDSSSLESIGIRNNCTVVLCIPMGCRGYNATATEEEAPVFIQWTTTEPCCVTDDDDTGVKRAKMPCGCVVGTEALKEHCEEKVGKGWFRFPCVKCDKIWPNPAVSEALSATIPDSDFESFARKLTQNYFSGSPAFKKCPFCGTYVRRDPSRHFLNVNWVECSLCTKKKGSSVTFCWNCDRAWMGSRESCGNSGCDGKDPRIKALKNCGKAKIGHISVDDVPKCRACVDCGRILEHDGGCKHMTCPCGCEFCFVCLKKKVKVGSGMDWQCGTYSTACSAAPRQEVIFEFQPMTKP